MKCPNCGARINKKYKMCPFCEGKIQIQETSANTSTYYKVIIGILSIALIIIALWIFLPNFFKINIEELKDSVVQIYVYDENDQVISTGSGVVAFDNDIIITNAHVVEGNYKLEVLSENNTKYEVKGIIGYNKKKDIAILKIQGGKNLKPLKIEHTLAIGEEVIAIGSPIGLKNTVSNGVFSRYFQDEIEVYQHTAPISHGSSGGALFNSKGELVGITFASLEEGQNINFAIPIKEVEKEYNIVKNNFCLDTQYYKFLNNGVLKTEAGSILMDYVLNDEYSNEKRYSGKTERGSLEFLTLNSNSDRPFIVGAEEIEEYVKSSAYISSGNAGTIYGDNEFGEIVKLEPDYYAVLIIKLQSSSSNAVERITKYFDKYFDINEVPTKYEIQHGNGYIYLIEYENYDNIDTVKTIMESFVKEKAPSKKSTRGIIEFLDRFRKFVPFLSK